ncbi:MAG: Tom37 metaxin N-terminal-like domain-containing protein [Litoreibacter sp.]
MLTLITFPTSFNEPSHSPFCAKAMILLQMSGQQWQRENVANPSPMPHGRLPVLRQKTGETTPDSEFIENLLTKLGADFYPGCTNEQKAIGHSIGRMVEDHLRLMLVHDRWLDDQNWSHVWPLFFEEVPRPIRKLIAGKARKSVKAALMGHGIARMTSEQRIEKAEKDLDALEEIIGANDYMLGGTPTAADAAILPVLSMIDRLPVETATTHLLQSKSWVSGYLQRGRATLYLDLI